MKTIKHSEQQSWNHPKLLQSWGHKRVLAKSWKLQKGAGKISREFCFALSGVWERALTTNIAPAT